MRLLIIGKNDHFKDTKKEDLDKYVSEICLEASKKKIPFGFNFDESEGDWVHIYINDKYSFSEEHNTSLSTIFALDFTKKCVNKILQTIKET